LANRLSENPKWKILLVEAGDFESFITNVPLFAAYFQSTSYNWGYKTEPQKNACLGMYGQQCGFPRGKGVGGSSIINYMIYNRGNKDDFNRWAAHGNKGWSWNDVLPYFKKSEHSTLSDLQNSPYHNKYGNTNIEYNRKRTIFADAFIEASQQLGQKIVDYNSGDQLGVSYLQANTINGQRDTAFRSFLKSILNKRPNLHLMVKTRATKILIDPKRKLAQGIEIVRNQKTFTVRARKEVILSAGAFSSPQLLMLSGIGPKMELNRIGVPVILDLPVGQNMHDHLCHLGPTFITNTTGVSLNSDRALNLQVIADYMKGQGELTIPGGVEALSFIKTKPGRGPTVPDMEIIFLPGGFHSDQNSGIGKGLRLREDIYRTVYKSLEDTRIDTFSFIPMLFHPKSIGYLTLKDKNPFHWPRFYPNYFHDEEDVETILAAIKFSLKLARTPPFKRLGARIYDTPLPNCAHHHFGSDNYWRCSIRTLSSTLHHQVGTCKMGPINDPTAVVSPELKVHGMRNLRVADTSIIPEATTSHTNAPSMMIGEKAADMIKAQWM
jgi:glucose dehydrogenase (acceptor)